MSSSVKDLTKIFEPTISEAGGVNDSFLSRSLGASKSTSTAVHMECNHQVPLCQNPSDEHHECADRDASGSSNDSSYIGGATQAASANESPIDSSSGGDTSPLETSQSQSQTSTPADGDSSDASSCPLQALQRSPPIAPPEAMRPLGQLVGNMQMFLEHSEYTESGHSRLREGKALTSEI